RDGGYAEYVAVPAENAYEITADISDAGLATFCCAYLTAEQMLDRARLTGGERILVTGASGGVGSAIIQLARVRGAIPYAVTSAGKEDALRDIGAEDVILRDSGDLVAETTQVDDGPVDVVADLVAGPMFNDLLRILRPQVRHTTAAVLARLPRRVPPPGRLHPGGEDPASAGPLLPPLGLPGRPAHLPGQDLYRQAGRGPPPALERRGSTSCAMNEASN